MPVETVAFLSAVVVMFVVFMAALGGAYFWSNRPD